MLNYRRPNSAVLSASIASITAFGCFVAFVGIGFVAYVNYSVSWDEPISRMNGWVNLKYALETFGFAIERNAYIPAYDTWLDKDYGVAFELPLVLLEDIFGLVESRDIYLMRHLVTHLYFSTGVVSIYLLVRELHDDEWIALWAAIAYMLMPRIYAESFYNSKDVVFMTAISNALYFCYLFFKKNNLRWSVAAAFFVAYAIDIRITGVFLFCLVLGIAILDILFLRERPLNSRCLLVFVVAAAFFVVAMFPYLWSSPVKNFLVAFEHMAKFRWDSDVLYLGEFYKSTKLPWHYPLVWILITTPIYLLAFFFAGFFVFLFRLSRVLFNGPPLRDMFSLLCVLGFFGPLIAILIIRPVLYDGWRQLYFLFPFLTIIASFGFAPFLYIPLRRIFRGALLLVVAISMGLTAFWMVEWHPFQAVFFNSFVRDTWKDKFEVDYWGLTNLRALNAIVDEDSRDLITVAAISATPLDRALLVMDKVRASRLLVVNRDFVKPQYIINNFRQMPDAVSSKLLEGYAPFHTVKVARQPVNVVYKLVNQAFATPVSRSDREYSLEELMALKIVKVGGIAKGREFHINVDVFNSSDNVISAVSGVDRQINLGWRYSYPKNLGYSWNGKERLPSDALPQGILRISIVVDRDELRRAGGLELSFVQEGAFWLHEHGVEPLVYIYED